MIASYPGSATSTVDILLIEQSYCEKEIATKSKSQKICANAYRTHTCVRSKEVECVHEQSTNIGEDVEPRITPNVEYDDKVETVEN